MDPTAFAGQAQAPVTPPSGGTLQLTLGSLVSAIAFPNALPQPELLASFPFSDGC